MPFRGVFSGRVAPDTLPASHCDAGGDLRQFSFCLLQKSAATKAAGVEFPSGERQPECQGGRARVAGLADVPHYLFKGKGYAMTPDEIYMSQINSNTRNGLASEWAIEYFDSVWNLGRGGFLVVSGGHGADVTS